MIQSNRQVKQNHRFKSEHLKQSNIFYFTEIPDLVFNTAISR